MKVYKRGIANPDNLDSDERLVYLLMELETYMDMEGWDHFFTTDKMRYYAELKGGLKSAGDKQSLEVLEHYEHYLRALGVEMQPNAIDAFLCVRDDSELDSCRDWRTDYNRLNDVRWQKVRVYLRGRGVELLT
jgi:hypothetical protein